VTSPIVVEDVEPDAREVSIQVLARIPRLTAKQADALDALVDELPRSVEGYSSRDIVTVTNGDRIRCFSGPDYVLVSFHVPSNNWRVGLSLMEAIVEHSNLTPPIQPTAPRPSAWTTALRPYVHTRAARPAEVSDLYAALFRPENLTLGIGGPIEPGKATADWTTRMARWTLPKFIPPSPYEPEPKELTTNPGGVSSLELTGPVFKATDASLPTRLLALFALGSGKGASLFRIARQSLVYSYRQEALLYPVPGGWESRLILLMQPTPDLAARADTVRKALTDDVNAWTEADRLRAVGMADAVLTRGVPFSPLALGPFGRLENSLEGRTFLQTYWEMKTGQPWNAFALLSAMRQVPLEAMRFSAAEILATGKSRLLPAG
jgi:hypothetical protein